MFSYANVPLSEATASADVLAFIQAAIRPEKLFPLAHRSWPESLIPPALNITPDIEKPIELNTLWWPVGASRFARAYYCVNDDQLNRIRQTTEAQGTIVSHYLVIDDGTTLMRIPMWMLQPWPLQQVGDGANLWLLVLVDDRYWWSRQAVSFTVTPGVTTWADLYSACGTAAGISITVDAVNTAYGQPVTDYDVSQRWLGGILDTIAFSVGQRIVRDPQTGGVRAMNALTAYNRVKENLVKAIHPYAGGILPLQ